MAEAGTQIEDPDESSLEERDGTGLSKGQAENLDPRFKPLLLLCRALQQNFSAALKSTDLAVQRLYQ